MGNKSKKLSEGGKYYQRGNNELYNQIILSHGHTQFSPAQGNYCQFI